MFPEFIREVAEFHQTFDHPILDTPQIPSEARCKLRVDLLQEELDELRDAIADGDIVAISDALGDLQVVLSGTILEFGLATRFQDIFTEVHRSNMSKSCSTMDEVRESVAYYETKGVSVCMSEKEGKYLLYRCSDHKTLKNINWSEPNLSQFLPEHAA